MGEIKVITEFNDEIIKQHLPFQGSPLTPIVEDIIKLKEQGVKEALSKLGYLNPDEAKELKRERDSTQARLEEAESKLNKALDAMDYLHSTCCSLITNATDCASHFEVSGNSMNALDDVVKSEEVQRILNIRLLDLKAGQPKHR